MSDTLVGLRRQIDCAGELKSVVRSMKALAAASIAQYETAIAALADYSRTVELGLFVCLRTHQAGVAQRTTPATSQPGNAIVFGSDQGLVGQFNDVLAMFVAQTLGALPGEKFVFAVGERIHSRLADADLKSIVLLPVPNSVDAIAPLVGRILVEGETHRCGRVDRQLRVFHNCLMPGGSYQPVHQQLLPLDVGWETRMARLSWPTNSLPEVIGEREPTLLALVREYLFVSLYKVCAESLASENSSRLAAMQRAEKNIDELLGDLNQSFRRIRQTSIDEELLDIVSGYELSN